MEKERYAQPETWAEVFRQEGHEVTIDTVRNRLHRARIRGVDARDSRKRNRKGIYYAESDVRRICSDLLMNLPRADEEGFVVIDDKVYGTFTGIARRLGISAPTVKRRLAGSSTEPIRALDDCWHFQSYYSVLEVQILCQDLLEELPQADEDGLIIIDSKIYGTTGSLSKLFGISLDYVKKTVRKHTLTSIRGKTRGGQIQTFHSEQEVRALFEDLLQDLPQANRDGLIIIEGESYRNQRSLSRLLGIAVGTIKNRMAEHSPTSIQGKAKGGQIQTFYSEQDIRALCQDLVGGLPKVNADGQILVDDVAYNAISSLSLLLGVSRPVIEKRIAENSVASIQGRGLSGRVLTFYSEQEIRALCQPLLEKQSIADDAGFIEVDGLLYGTVRSIARAHGIHRSSVRSRIKKYVPQAISGKDRMGKIRTFYPLEGLRKLSADLLAKKSKK